MAILILKFGYVFPRQLDLVEGGVLDAGLQVSCGLLAIDHQHQGALNPGQSQFKKN